MTKHEISLCLDRGILKGMCGVISQAEKAGTEIVVEYGGKIRRISVDKAKEIMRRLKCPCVN